MMIFVVACALVFVFVICPFMLAQFIHAGKGGAK